MHVIGEIKGRVCVLVDDIVDSAGTLCSAADALAEEGAEAVYAYITHPVLSGRRRLGRIQASKLREMVVTDHHPLVAGGRIVR